MKDPHKDPAKNTMNDPNAATGTMPSQPPMGAPTPSAGADLIADASMENFSALVIEASMQRPVLVDFWADWCSPCKQMMPLLEKAVVEAAGAVTLVKVNADDNQALCAQLRIQSLPTVMAFHAGQPIDGFQGALPESQLKQFIAGVIEKTGAAPAAGSMEAQIAQVLDQVRQAIQHKAYDQALQMLSQVLEVAPEHLEATVLYATVTLETGGAAQAKQILDRLPADCGKDNKDLADQLQSLKTRIDLSLQMENTADLSTLLAALEADPMDHQARYDLSLAYLAAGDQAKAAEELLQISVRDMTWQEEAARKQLLKLFEAAGPTDPFTLKYRRRLSSLLFS